MAEDRIKEGQSQRRNYNIMSGIGIINSVEGTGEIESMAIEKVKF